MAVSEGRTRSVSLLETDDRAYSQPRSTHQWERLTAWPQDLIDPQIMVSTHESLRAVLSSSKLTDGK